MLGQCSGALHRWTSAVATVQAAGGETTTAAAGRRRDEERTDSHAIVERVRAGTTETRAVYEFGVYQH